MCFSARFKMIILTDGGLSLGANVFGIVYGSVKFQRL